MVLQVSHKPRSSVSNSLDISGIIKQEITPPTTVDADPIKKTSLLTLLDRTKRVLNRPELLRPDGSTGFTHRRGEFKEIAAKLVGIEAATPRARSYLDMITAHLASQAGDIAHSISAHVGRGPWTSAAKEGS